MNVSIEDMEARIQINAGRPHVYFSKQYAAITILDQENKEKYHESFIGTATYAAKLDKVKLAIGDLIRVEHEEPQHKLIIQNQMNQLYLENNKTVTYRVTSNGLVVVK